MATLEILKELSLLNLSTYPERKVEDLIWQLNKYLLNLKYIPIGTKIVRARANCNFEEYSKKSELTYKPSEFNKTYQRASTPRTTMFYGAVDPDGYTYNNPRHDVRRLIGACEVSRLMTDASIIEGEQTVTYGLWIVTKEICIAPTIFNFDSFPQSPFVLNFQKEIKNEMASYSDKIIEDTNLISEFFDRQFSKNGIDHDYEYLISAMYAERLIRYPNPCIYGVLYPSIKYEEKKGFNIAITPWAADNCLKLDTVLECNIYKKYGQIFISNDKEAILSEGQTEFTLMPITRPLEHFSKEQVYNSIFRLIDPEN